MKKHWGKIFFLFLIFFFIWIFNYKPDLNDSRKVCRRKFNKIIKYGIDGKVSKKFIDENNHSYPIIEVTSLSGSITRINLALDESKLFDSLEVGFLFRKYNGDSAVYYGATSLDKVIEINYKCEDWKSNN